MVRPANIAAGAVSTKTIWVSATATRNFMLDDPIIDWFERFGATKGFVRDDQLEGYDERADYARFLFGKGKEFEAAVLNYVNASEALREKPPIRVIDRPGAVAPDDEAGRRCLAATHSAMTEGVPVIYQGMVSDELSRTYGFPDFLIRSDILGELFPNMAGSIQLKRGADGIRARDYHYVVIDAKYTTLKLNAQQELGNEQSQPAYKAQLYLYNRALGTMQGFTPQYAYLLGRGWEQGKNHESNDAVDRLGLAPQNGTITHGMPLGPKVDDAVDWIRRLNADGGRWTVGPPPSVEELRPNASITEDSPWHHAKHAVAKEQGEITCLWQVGIAARKAAVVAGITDWRDPRCTPESLGVKATYLAKAHAIMDVNRDGQDPPVRPAHVSAGEATWRPATPLEFFVDFETVNNLDDDFTMFPIKGGQPLIFMIGCGHMEEGRWNFKCFTAKWLDEPSEADIIDQWLQHMEIVRKRMSPTLEAPIVYHWSPAESQTLEKAYNSAMNRHPANHWRAPAWFDLWGSVVKAEPFVVRGAMGFGLKSIAKSLNALGLIETTWKDAIVDGLGAMAAAWWANLEARRQNVPMETLPLMQAVIEYNQIDCKAMMETLHYIRSHH